MISVRSELSTREIQGALFWLLLIHCGALLMLYQKNSNIPNMLIPFQYFPFQKPFQLKFLLGQEFRRAESSFSFINLHFSLSNQIFSINTFFYLRVILLFIYILFLNILTTLVKNFKRIILFNLFLFFNLRYIILNIYRYTLF